MTDVKDLVFGPGPPEEVSEDGRPRNTPPESSAAMVWLRRVAFLLAAAAPALGCTGGSGNVDVCERYAATVVQCYSGEQSPEYIAYYQAYYEQYCNMYLEYGEQHSPQCGAMTRQYYACISWLSCEQIENGYYSDCADEANAMSQHCYGY